MPAASAGDSLLQPRDVATDVESVAVTKHEPIVRVEPQELDYLVKIAAAHGEHALEDLGVKKKGRTAIETKPVLLECRGTPAWRRLALDHENVRAGLGQQHRARQAARPRADYDDIRFLHAR